MSATQRSEQAEDGLEDDGRPRSSGLWATLALSAGVVLVVVSVSVAVIEWHHAHSLSSSDGSRVAASQVAGVFAQDLLSFDSTHPTATLERLKAMATASYQPKIAAAQQAALAGSTSAVQTKASATIDAVYLTEVSGSAASAVCEATWVVFSNGQAATPLDFYLKLDLRDEGGTWKVNNVLGLAALAPTGGSSNSAPTTTVPSSATTAPASTGTTP